MITLADVLTLSSATMLPETAGWDRRLSLWAFTVAIFMGLTQG